MTDETLTKAAARAFELADGNIDQHGFACDVGDFIALVTKRSGTVHVDLYDYIGGGHEATVRI